MNIQIKDSVGLTELDVIELVSSLLKNREPKEGSFDYRLETHGVIGIRVGSTLKYPIEVFQSNKRKTDKCPIVITIRKHNKII